MKPMDAIVRFSSKPGGRRIIYKTIKEVTPVAKDLAVKVAPVAAPVVLAAGAVYGVYRLCKWIKE